MSPLNRIISSAVCLAATVLAAPTAQNPSSSVAQPRWKECEVGTWYTKCGDIDGCFDYDPCSEGLKDESTAPACPTDLIKEDGLRVLPSSYWNINPNAPNQRYSENNIIHLINDTSRSDGFDFEQVLVFKGIDVSRAKTCKLVWYMDLQPETQFKVDGDGYVQFAQLPGFPVLNEAPSYNFVQQFETEDAPGFTPAMGGWDDKSAYLGKKMKSAEEVPCSEVMAFKAMMDGMNNDGLNQLYMVPSDTIGVAIDYWC